MLTLTQPRTNAPATERPAYLTPALRETGRRSFYSVVYYVDGSRYTLKLHHFNITWCKVYAANTAIREQGKLPESIQVTRLRACPCCGTHVAADLRRS